MLAGAIEKPLRSRLKIKQCRILEELRESSTPFASVTLMYLVIEGLRYFFGGKCFKVGLKGIMNEDVQQMWKYNYSLTVFVVVGFQDSGILRLI